MTNGPYGFTWGPLTVTRLAIFSKKDRDTRIVQIKTEAGKSIQVYVSRTGRSIRVWRDGKELT